MALSCHCSYSLLVISVIGQSSAAWHEWAPLRAHVLICSFLPLFRRSVIACRRTFLGFHLFTLGEASSEAKRAASPPCVFMGSQQWFTEQVILSSLSAWADQHFTLLLLFPLSQRAIAFFSVSHKRIHRYRRPVWVDGAPRAQLPLLQLWVSSSLLYEKRKLPRIVLILTEI